MNKRKANEKLPPKIIRSPFRSNPNEVEKKPDEIGVERQLLLTEISTNSVVRTRACVRDAQEGLQDASEFSGGIEGKLRSNVVDQSTRSPDCACASSPVVSLVWVPRARPQTYHFFGDSRRGNILVLVLVLVLASSPRHHEFNKVLTRSSVFNLSIRIILFFLPFLYFTRVSHFFIACCLSSIREFHIC